MSKRWVWDIECYPNLFLVCAKHCETGERRRFQVSPLGDDRDALAYWLKEEVEEMVGFNSLFYDYPVLHYALSHLWNLRGRDFCAGVFKFSSNIIKGKRIYLKDKDYVRKQIDLFKINHYDNKAKMTSLKLLQFNLRLKNIKELPYEPGTVLSNEQIQVVIDYCDNDADATELVYVETIPEIELREKLSPQYNIDFTNYNSTKIGEWILISKIIKELGEDVVYDKFETEYGIKRVIKNTKRDTIDLNDVIFPYVAFTTEPFEKILQWFKSRIITETKGVFSGIPFEELKSLEPHYFVEKEKGKQKTLNVVYKGFQYDFGVGGIHGSVSPGIYSSDDEYEIWDVDVASYYPNLAIKNRFYPEHFGEVFCDIYEGIYIERQGYDKNKFPAENLALKLALNGSYGKSNSAYSPLYDPLYTMKTTVNGQLLLCMLSERFMEEIPDCKMIQINTDGMTVKIHKQYREQLFSICKRWETLTGLELESVMYSKMIIKDVNNYIAVKTDGGVKRKGAAFIYKVAPGELELHKNFSMLIVPKALEAYFVNNQPVEDFIRNHNEMYDFFKRTKINKTDKLFSRVLDENGNIAKQTEIQRVTRYFVSGSQSFNKNTKTFEYYGSGTTLIKEMPPLATKETKKLLNDYNKIVREQFYQGTLEDYKELVKTPRNTNIEAGYLCTVINDLDDISEDEMKSKLNYQYYIDEVYKVINLIEHKV